MTAGGSYGAGGAVAGWYPDPRDPRLLRYWDGMQWTAHTSPASAPLRAPAGSHGGGSKKAISAIVIVVGVLALLVVIGILVAIAIPVFLSQREKAADASAKADVATLGKEVATWYVDHAGGPPSVTTSGGEYLVDHVVVGEISPNVQFGGITATGSTDWCVWVTNPSGDLKDFEYSAEWGLAQGSC
jgi:type II secretory pathway pseudopilin PulG